MPLTLNATTGNISTPTGDTGVYTWADIVALNSPRLTTYTLSPGKFIYRWNGLITMRGTSTLNIENITIELLGTSTANPGRIEALESATVNFGQVTTVSSQTVYRNGCELIVTSNYNAATIGNAQLAFSTTTATSTGSKVNIYGCNVTFNISTGIRTKIYISNIFNSYVWGNFANANLRNVINVQNGGFINGDNFLYVSLELNSTVNISDIKSTLPDSTIINYNSASRISLANIKASVATNDYFVSRASAFDFVDSEITLSNGLVQRDDTIGVTTLENRKLFSQSIRIIDSLGNVSNALVAYKGRSNISLVTTATGLFTTNVIVEETNLAGMTTPAQFGSYSKPLLLISYSNYTREIKSYRHKTILETITVSGQLGTATQPFQYNLLVDDGISQTQVEAEAIAGINHTVSTITVTGDLTLQQIFDSRKAYWRNTDNVVPLVRVGDIINFGATNLIVDGGDITPTIKFQSIITTGFVSIINNSSATFPITDVNGLRFKIYGLPLDGNPRVRIRRVSDDTRVYLSAVNGEAYVVLQTGVEYIARADAEGYQRVVDVPINTTTQTSALITLPPIRNSDGSNPLLLAIQGEVDCINYDYSTMSVVVSYDPNFPTISAESALVALEKFQSGAFNQSGLDQQYPITWQDGKLVFANLAQSKIKSNVNNTGIPLLNFEILHGGYDTPHRLFDFSNGKVFSYLTTANIAKLSGPLNAITDNAAIAAAVEQVLADKFAAIPTTPLLANDSRINDFARKNDIVPASTIATAVDNALTDNFGAIAPAIRAELTLELGRIDATVSSRATNLGVEQQLANEFQAINEGLTGATNLISLIPGSVWTITTRTLSSGSNIVLAKGVGITGFNDPSAEAIATQINAPSISEIVAGTEASLIIAKQATLSGLDTRLTEARVSKLDRDLVTTSQLNTVFDAIPTASEIWTNSTRSLTTPFPIPPTVAQIEASTVLAKRTDLTPLTNLDVAVSTRATVDGVWTRSQRSLTSFGTLVADIVTAIWSATTRTLSSGANIVLGKGIGVTGFNDLSITDIQTTIEASTVLAKTEDLASVAGMVSAIPTNPALATDVRFSFLDTSISSRASGSAVANLVPLITAIPTQPVNLANITAKIDTIWLGFGYDPSNAISAKSPSLDSPGWIRSADLKINQTHIQNTQTTFTLTNINPSA